MTLQIKMFLVSTNSDEVLSKLVHIRSVYHIATQSDYRKATRFDRVDLPSLYLACNDSKSFFHFL